MRAVVRRRQLAGDGLLHVEALPEDHGLAAALIVPAARRGPDATARGGSPLRHRRRQRRSIGARTCSAVAISRSRSRIVDRTADAGHATGTGRPATGAHGDGVGDRRARAHQPGADLAADDAEHETGGGGDADPGRRRRGDRSAFAVERSGCAGNAMTRDGSSSCSSLRRICVCCAARRSGVNARSAASSATVAHVVEPAAELDARGRRRVAPIEVRGAFARHDRLDERALGQMSLTKHRINEPHG